MTLLDAKSSFLLLIDMQERLLPVISGSDIVERNCAILLQAARQMRVPGIISEQYPKGLGKTVPALSQLASADAIMEKVEFSCARNADLIARIEATNRKQAVLCGVESHICVLQSALELKARGFDVFVAIDGTGSRNDQSKEIATDRMLAAGVTVVTTEMVVFEFARTAASSDFKYLAKLIQ